MGGSKGDKNSNRERSRSPVRPPPPPPAVSNELVSRDSMMQMMSDVMSAQIPKLIMETSKVVAAQLQSEDQENSRSYTMFSQEMKQLKLRTEEVESKAKAAALKSEGGYLTKE